VPLWGRDISPRGATLVRYPKVAVADKVALLGEMSPPARAVWRQRGRKKNNPPSSRIYFLTAQKAIGAVGGDIS